MYNNLLRLAQEYQWYRNTNGTGVPMVILILYFNPVLNLYSTLQHQNLYLSTSPRLFTHLGFLSMTYYCEICETYSFE